MLTTWRKLGNSHGVIIPAQIGLTGEAEMKAETGAIVLRPARRGAEACRELAARDEGPAVTACQAARCGT
jgi:antitoxin component of MazEF toxin-antitoxin module